MINNALTQRIRDVALQTGMQRYTSRSLRSVQPAMPITDGVGIPTTKEACHDLFMATSAYYLKRASRGLSMPREISTQLLALHGAIHNPAGRIGILSDSMAFFLRTAASVESKDIRDAIKAAQLSLRTLQDTYAELPVIDAVIEDDRWAL